MFSSLLCLLLAQDAFAVPLQMNHQGRLLDSEGNGLTGSHELIFRIMDDPEDGYALYTETQTVNFINGYYSVLLGADEENNPLDDSIFANYPLHLALKVDGENLEPRQPMTSVPYAQIAGVAESVDGGTVNASEVNVGGQAVINADGQWVGEAPTVDFMNLQNRPQGLDDGDDNTQLDQTEVVDYVNGSQVNLGAASQVDGSNIVTAGDFDTYLPTDLADGDNDLLASISCAVGELISWDGNASWVCVSDNTLELADIETMLANNPMDLNAATTIGGLDIVTSIDDSDTLASLSCQNDGEIARYDLVLDEWYCDTDIDTDTVLDQAGVLAHVNGEALSLASGTQVNGSDVVTVDTFASNLPSDLADGDADTQLDQAGVLGFVDGQTINLGTGSQVDGSNIVTAGDFDTYLPTELADGDADTLASLSCAQGELAGWDGNSSWVCVSDNTLDESTVEGYITNEVIDLYAGSQVDGRNIVTQPSACSDGQVLTFDSANNDWTCGDINSSSSSLSPLTVDSAITLAPYQVHEYSEITITSAGSITLSSPGVLILKSHSDITIDGTIDLSGQGTSGGSGGSFFCCYGQGGNGGNGGGSVILLSDESIEIGSNGFINVSGTDGTNGTDGGYASTGWGNNQGNPGNAGSAQSIYGESFSGGNGGATQKGGRKAVSLSTTFGSPTSFATSVLLNLRKNRIEKIPMGQGGGGGGSHYGNGNGCCTTYGAGAGGAGGNGGLVAIISADYTNNGTINISGGSGGDPGNTLTNNIDAYGEDGNDGYVHYYQE